jgi:hypothetical protein
LRSASAPKRGKGRGLQRNLIPKKKKQILALCKGAEQGGKGVDYKKFIIESASPAILAIGKKNSKNKK